MTATAMGTDDIKAARAMLQARDPSGALTVLKEAAAHGQRTGELMELIGVAQGMLGNTSASRDAFEEATKLDPSRATAHYNYAIVLSRDGELEHAMAEAGTAVLIDPKHSGAAQLQQQLAQRIRELKYVGEETFKTVGRDATPNARTSGILGQMSCGVCGKPNLFSARVCRHCGTFIQEMPDVVPVE